MRNETVRIPVREGLDFKALGYVISIFSVFLLGAAAWPKENAPVWYHPILIAGMATSILGMASRYKSHLDEKREIKRAQAKADSKR